VATSTKATAVAISTTSTAVTFTLGTLPSECDGGRGCRYSNGGGLGVGCYAILINDIILEFLELLEVHRVKTLTI